MIYEFKTLGAPIVSLAQTPVVDVVAIGLNDGRILIHNIRSDKTVMQFKQDDRVSAFAFRTGTQILLFSTISTHELI